MSYTPQGSAFNPSTASIFTPTSKDQQAGAHPATPCDLFMPPPIEMSNNMRPTAPSFTPNSTPFVPSSGSLPAQLNQVASLFSPSDALMNPTYGNYCYTGEAVDFDYDYAGMHHKPYIQVKPDKVCVDHELGKCTRGANCWFAHGESEREANNQLYIQQRMNTLGIKFKTNYCRSFTREKYCAYGPRCHYTHEKRGMAKLHRHFY